MKVEAPADLQGRMYACRQRAKMIGTALQAITHSELCEPDTDTLNALGAVALELSEELEAIERAYGSEANAEGGAR